MKSQTLAISIVLLLITVAALPGLSFSLSSSVTSQDNDISYDTGGIKIPDDSGYGAIKIEDGTFGDNEAYEIATSDGSFGTGKVSLTIPGEKSFKICIKIDGWNLLGTSYFNLTIDHTGDGTADIIAEQLDGGRLTAVNNIKTGYLYCNNPSGQGQWQLTADVNSATTITSSSEHITVDIKGQESFAGNIHFYILFI